MTMGFKLQSFFKNSTYNYIPQIYYETANLQNIDNPSYYKLIKDFGKKTGVYCLLNTSLNIHGHQCVVVLMMLFLHWKILN